MASIDGAEDDFRVALADGRILRTRRIVLATGVRDVLPPVPGLTERWGRSVLHCPYCHGYEVADRPLGVLATHAMSLHTARLLPDWGPIGTYARVGPMQATSVPGAFACGDLAAMTTNATLAASSGMLAGVGAHQSLAMAA